MTLEEPDPTPRAADTWWAKLPIRQNSITESIHDSRRALSLIQTQPLREFPICPEFGIPWTSIPHAQ